MNPAPYLKPGWSLVCVLTFLLLSLRHVAGRHLPREPHTGRCWHCGHPTESATGVCEACREGER